MAQPVNRRVNRAIWHQGMLLALGWLALPVLAENLPDPTRPSGAAYANENAVTASGGPVLQSVLTSAGRKLAIINGQTVKQGDVIGNARVAKIGDAEVVLVQGKETQVLRLFPVVEKQPSTMRPSPKSGMRK